MVGFHGDKRCRFDHFWCFCRFCVRVSPGQPLLRMKAIGEVGRQRECGRGEGPRKFAAHLLGTPDARWCVSGRPEDGLDNAERIAIHRTKRFSGIARLAAPCCAGEETRHMRALASDRSRSHDQGVLQGGDSI